MTQRKFDSIQQLPLGLQYNNLDLENKAGYFLSEVKKEAFNIIRTSRVLVILGSIGSFKPIKDTSMVKSGFESVNS